MSVIRTFVFTLCEGASHLLGGVEFSVNGLEQYASNGT